jgi:hypothetical protein
VFLRLRVSTDPGLASPASVSGSRQAIVTAGYPKVHEVQGLPLPRVSARETGPGTVVEKALEGEDPRRAPAGGLTLAKGGLVAERTPGGSKASKWACRPSTGEPSSLETWTARAARSARRGDRPQRTRGTFVPAHASRSAFGRIRLGKELGASGESDREFLEKTALAAVEREPTRKQGPARAGTAPREGKALEGSSRDASGMKEGRKALGATANGGV